MRPIRSVHNKMCGPKVISFIHGVTLYDWKDIRNSKLFDKRTNEYHDLKMWPEKKRSPYG